LGFVLPLQKSPDSSIFSTRFNACVFVVLDVLIDLRHDTDNSRRLIVDAKKRRRRIDVVQVEAFKGLMEDVGAIEETEGRLRRLSLSVKVSASSEK
jgi:hypothetical protein